MAGHLLVQISDVHLTTAGRLPGGAAPREHLSSGLALLEERGIHPDVLLLTGDLTDAGEAACYDDLAALVGAATAASGAKAVYLPGNHDDRATFRRHLLERSTSATGGEEGPRPTGQAAGQAAGPLPGSAAEGPINQVHWHGGLRILALDSVVPGEDRGELAEETFALLAEVLAEPAPEGTILALHHPPVPSPIEQMAAIALADPDRLAAAVEGSDVRLVVCGHYHHAAAGNLGRVPVWVGPATAYRADVTSTKVFRGVPGSAFSRIEVTSEGGVATVIPLGGDEQV